MSIVNFGFDKPFSVQNQLDSKILQESIKQTMAYLRLVRSAVTAEELYRFLWRAPIGLAYGDFLLFLDQSGVDRSNGFVCFSDQDRLLVEERRQAAIPTDLMLKRARRAVRLVEWVPFLQTILVCNSVGAETARMESDIDWLTITAPKRIWLVRALMNITLRLTGLRTYGHHEAGRMCLSFFIDNDHRDFGPLRAVSEDIHFAYWLHQMVPVYGAANEYKKLLAENGWARELLPLFNPEVVVPNPLPYRPGQITHWIKRRIEAVLSGSFGDWLERFVEKVQRAKLSPVLVEKARRNDNGVVLAPGVLKFHERDTRRSIYEAWQEVIAHQKSSV